MLYDLNILSADILDKPYAHLLALEQAGSQNTQVSSCNSSR